MKKILLLLWLGAFTAQHSYARHACADNRVKHNLLTAAKVAAASPLLDDYDVKYVNLSLTMSNLNTSIAGFAETKAVVTNPSGMSTYAFELDSVITIDSVFINGTRWTTISTLSRDVKAATSLSLANGATFTARIYYHGTPPAGNNFFTRGLVHVTIPSAPVMTYSMSDPNLAKDWWPCKQSLIDKIDSADLNFRVPIGNKAGSNGVLKQVVPAGTGYEEFQWKTRYPIEYYLISVAVAPYMELNQTVHFTGGSDTMPVQHFVYDTSVYVPIWLSAIDSTPYMVDYLSTLYGRYPFWKEKYGHCIAPLSGGMEHQTMTTFGAYTTPLVAHELGHQWWGDCVTYASWLDIWMSEGWASYTEQLFLEHFWGAAAAQAYRSNVFNRVMGAAGGTVYVSDTTDVYRIFDSRLTYDKGASVAHMLRYIAPSDATFFNGLKAYQQQYAYKTATTDSFRKVMEAAYGRPLDTFFNQWIYKAGYPNYGGTWNQRGSDVYVQLTQAGSVPSSINVFAMPLMLQLKSYTGDTLVKVYFDQSKQTYHFTWNREMYGFVVDPNDDVLNGKTAVTNDPALGVSLINSGILSIYPNPTPGGWKISGLITGSVLKLVDVTGKAVWEQDNVPHSVDINARSLPKGIYTLQVQSPDSALASFKLEKL